MSKLTEVLGITTNKAKEDALKRSVAGLKDIVKDLRDRNTNKHGDEITTLIIRQYIAIIESSSEIASVDGRIGQYNRCADLIVNLSNIDGINFDHLNHPFKSNWKQPEPKEDIEAEKKTRKNRILTDVYSELGVDLPKELKVNEPAKKVSSRPLPAPG